MVSTLNLEEKYNKVRKHFCFYIDLQDHGLARSLSRRLEDMGLQQEVFLTARVTHVVRDAPRCSVGRSRADAMLQRVRPPPPTLPSTVVQLTVQKAISLLDKLYDTFFPAPRKANVKYFTKHYIKIEFLDKLCRPVFKEFDVWPEISLEPDPPKEKKDKNSPAKISNDINQNHQTVQKMTRKSRPRLKERSVTAGAATAEPRAGGGAGAGYCEMCHCEYADAALHRRSPHHTAFVRDHTNFLALDSLITAGADVATFLDKATTLNGERRSLRNACNGDDKASPVNGRSPRQYYKVVGVSTKLRSSGGFAPKRKESPVTCNGAEPLVVKFRKVRRSELSVLSDEAEQFMFPKRASSASSTSSDDDDEPQRLSPRRRSPPPPPASTERRRLARPLALKEESSEEDGWPEDAPPRRRRAPPATQRRRGQGRPAPAPAPEEPAPPPATTLPAEAPRPSEPPPAPAERCMKWEDGRLKYTPAVEQLEFAFESVPRSEPWFETFQRQDQDKVATKNVPQYFALYNKSPKLPYEIGHLPPLKPNCCPLSDLVKRDDKAGPSRSYGTRGMKKQKIRKRVAAVLALDSRPRKSPREHASTRAMLGPRGPPGPATASDDARSTGTASDDTSDAPSARLEPAPASAPAPAVAADVADAADRLQQFLSEVFDDAAEYDVSSDAMDGEPALATSHTAPDVSSLVSECDGCDLIRDEIENDARARKARRGKFKKKNRTGWPNKKRPKKDSRTTSLESEAKADSLGRSSAEPAEEEAAPDTVSEEDGDLTDAERDDTVVAADGQDDTLVEEKPAEEEDQKPEEMEVDSSPGGDKAQTKRSSRSSASEPEEREERRRKKRALAGLLLQPVVRVARVEPGGPRRLRSAARPPPRPRPRPAPRLR